MSLELMSSPCGIFLLPFTEVCVSAGGSLCFNEDIGSWQVRVVFSDLEPEQHMNNTIKQ